MATPFLGQISLFSFDFAPQGWALCNGQLLPVNQNQALFALLGTTYGGDGRTTFALPDLRGRTPIHVSPTYVLGQRSGSETQTLSLAELPTHTHVMEATSNNAMVASPANAVLATVAGPLYADRTSAPLVDMATNQVSSTGGFQSHENRQPLLALNFCIALQGLFPARN